MKKSQQEVQKILETKRCQKLFSEARDTRSQCYAPGCVKPSISSHILQKSGILDHIAENQHIRQFTTNDRKLGPNNYSFERVGINATDVMTFNGFCNEHDTSIFLDIEKPNADFSIYRNQVLFSYKALLNEMFKVEIKLRYYGLVYTDGIISYKRKDLFKRREADMVARLKSLYFYKSLLEIELTDSNCHEFRFHYFELPKVDIATSATFSMEKASFLTLAEVKALKYSDSYFQLNYSPKFIHAIPREKSLVVIVGYHKSSTNFLTMPLVGISSLKYSQVLQLISDLFLMVVETWCLSETLYSRLVFQDKIREYLQKAKAYYILKYRYGYVPMKFSLFDGIT